MRLGQSGSVRLSIVIANIFLDSRLRPSSPPDTYLRDPRGFLLGTRSRPRTTCGATFGDRRGPCRVCILILIEGCIRADRCQRNQDLETYLSTDKWPGLREVRSPDPKTRGENSGTMTRSTHGRAYAGEMTPIYPRPEIIRYKAPVQEDTTAVCTGLPGWPLCGGTPCLSREFAQPTTICGEVCSISGFHSTFYHPYSWNPQRSVPQCKCESINDGEFEIPDGQPSGMEEAVAGGRVCMVQ